MQTNKLQVENVPIESVTPYPNNPRTNARAISYVAAAIKEFGFLQPIVVDAHRVIIAGHTRLEAAKQLGLKEVPIHVATDLSEKQVKAYRIADNRSGEVAEWEDELLRLELSELRGSHFNMASTGFAIQDIDLMLAPIDADEASFIDTTSAPRVREGRRPIPPDPESIQIGDYLVAITNAEFKRAFARVERHANEWGSVHGFVSSLLGIEVVEGLE